MGRFLGIAGTPGTGKKTIAPLVAKALGLQVVGINDLLTARERTTASLGADPAKLRRRLLKRTMGTCIVYGHMVPDVLAKRDVSRVVVLRCEPSALARRLRQRKYSPAKIADNVEAELIGVVSADCVSKFGREKVVEFDTTSATAKDSAKAVRGLLSGKSRAGAPVDWVPFYSSAEKLRSLLSEASTDSALT